MRDQAVRRSAQPRSAGATIGWRVRLAGCEDVPAVAGGVRELLLELGATPAPVTALEDAARAVIEGDGTVLLAQAEDGDIYGLLAASWQHAIHVPGRYALIQDLWVQPACRGSAIGAELVAALCSLAHRRGVARIEVGLPSERFQSLAATRNFYEANGFLTLGLRMKRILS